MLLVALVLPVSLFAQTNAVSIFVNRPSFSSTSGTDPVENLTIKIAFDSKIGYGASYDRFFSPNLSAQFLAQKLRGGLKASLTSGSVSITDNAGTLDATQYDAALHWHFGTGAVRPYVGGGIGTIRGAKVRVPADATDSGVEESFSLDNKISWVADAGVDFRISPNASITVTAKYMPYSSGVGAEPGDPIQRLKLDPLTFAAGVQWRF
jgi:outer membrane protein W